MKLEILKNLIKEAVRETVREEVGLILLENKQNVLRENLSFTSNDVMPIVTNKKQPSSNLRMLNDLPPKQTSSIPTTNNATFDDILAQTAAELSPGELRNFTQM